MTRRLYSSIVPSKEVNVHYFHTEFFVVSVSVLIHLPFDFYKQLIVTYRPFRITNNDVYLLSPLTVVTCIQVFLDPNNVIIRERPKLQELPSLIRQYSLFMTFFFFSKPKVFL